MQEVCRLYDSPTPKTPEQNSPPPEIAQIYVSMTGTLRQIGYVSVASYVQLTDTEMECDGIISYDRTPKFSQARDS